ncbi:HNH endonuclease signature motif containing protein [Phycicoccus sp. Root101]|uniref:HNH endonuclease signature motif containing protein n=1 Tax=Phycicoccus sp. Root101 TaxID=1736421 RepID=UPI00138F67BB|nr:HNH endonuclease signature motif containing protein [Phycicoccus sp. Root101]
MLSRGECDRLWALGDGEVGAAVGVLSEVVAAARAQLVLVLAEAKGRGLGVERGLGAADWVRSVAPLLPTRDLLDAEVVASVVAESAAVGSVDHRLDELVDAVAGACSSDPELRADALAIGKAAQICRFHRAVRGMAEPAGLAGATSQLVFGARGAGGLSEARLAVALRHAGEVARPDGSVERDAQVRRDHRSLTKGPGPVGMWRYTLLLDEEGAAVVDAAVDALARPVRDEDTGELDLRTPAARRADALLDLVTRAVSAPEGLPRQAKTSLVVTVGLDALQGRCRGAALTAGDESLTVGAVRRLACDAQVIPVVLGSRGEVLDQGMGRRLFDRAQIRHLWLRDRHCTFPGCSKPAAWSDAHHLVHWADGGPTDIDNAALLCRAHHTVVHTNRYGGRLRRQHGSPQVEWDLTVGSYDTTLDEWRQRARTRPGP